MQDIARLELGDYLVEFGGLMGRFSGGAIAASPKEAKEVLDATTIHQCALRIVGGPKDGLEVEDRSRMTASATPGARFIATVRKHSKFASFVPVNEETKA